MMRPVKRVEIVVETVELPKVIQLLFDAPVLSYTVVKEVVGCAERCMRDGDDLTDVITNVYVMAVCTADQVPSLVDLLRPILQRFGGTCLVSDAEWVVH
jgi:nitrogen regulatory protein PII